MRKKMVGSIMAQKFTFEDLKVRTAKTTEPFKLIYLINNKLGHKKNGTNVQNLELSRLVPSAGIEPAQFPIGV